MTKVATEDGHHAPEEPRWKNPLLAMSVGLWLALGLIAVFFVGLLVGVTVVSLGLGITLLLIAVASNRSGGHDGT